MLTRPRMKQFILSIGGNKFTMFNQKEKKSSGKSLLHTTFFYGDHFHSCSCLSNNQTTLHPFFHTKKWWLVNQLLDNMKKTTFLLW